MPPSTTLERGGAAPLPVPELGGTGGRTVGAVPDGSGAGRASGAARLVLVGTGALLGSFAVGSLLGARGPALLHNRMLPWILGRSFGVASYLALTALVLVGIWLRHPWRSGRRRPSPASLLWAHVALAAATVTLLVGHLTSLALDKYAGVGWWGVALPWGAHYRPTPVALGVMAMYLMLLVIGTAALAGSIGRRIWFPIHTVSVLVFCMTLVHGVLAGSDAYSLRWIYVVTGVTVLGLQVTRWIGEAAGHGAAAVVE